MRSNASVLFVLACAACRPAAAPAFENAGLLAPLEDDSAFAYIDDMNVSDAGGAPPVARVLDAASPCPAPPPGAVVINCGSRFHLNQCFGGWRLPDGGITPAASPPSPCL